MDQLLLRVSSRLVSSLDANVLKRVFKLLNVQYPGRREEARAFLISNYLREDSDEEEDDDSVEPISSQAELVPFILELEKQPAFASPTTGSSSMNQQQVIPSAVQTPTAEVSSVQASTEVSPVVQPPGTSVMASHVVQTPGTIAVSPIGQPSGTSVMDSHAVQTPTVVPQVVQTLTMVSPIRQHTAVASPVVQSIDAHPPIVQPSIMHPPTNAQLQVVEPSVSESQFSCLIKRLKDIEDELQFVKEDNKRLKRTYESTEWLKDDGEEEASEEVKIALAKGEEQKLLEMLKDSSAKVNAKDVFVNMLAEKIASERADKVFNAATVRLEHRAEFRASSSIYKHLKKATLIAKDENHYMTMAVKEMENRAFELTATKVNPKVGPLLESFENPILEEKSDLLQTLLKAVGKADDTSKQAIQQIKVQEAKSTVCNYCKQLGHIAANCRKRKNEEKEDSKVKNKSSSLYPTFQFFLRPTQGRDSREEDPSSLSFQSLEALGGSRSLTRNSGYLERGSSNPRQLILQEELSNGRFKYMASRGSRLPGEGDKHVHCYQNTRGIPWRPGCCGSLQIGQQERFKQIQNGCEFETIEQVLLWNSRLQVQDPQEVFGVAIDQRGVLRNVRSEGWLPPSEGKEGGQKQTGNRIQWEIVLLYCTTIWMEWQSLLFHYYNERISEIVSKRRLYPIQLSGRFLYDPWRGIRESSGIDRGFSQSVVEIWPNPGANQRKFLPNENFGVVGCNCEYCRIQIVHPRCWDFKDRVQMQRNPVQAPHGNDDMRQRFGKSSWNSYCIHQLFPTSCDSCQFLVLYNAYDGGTVWMGWYVVTQGYRCYIFSAMGAVQYSLLEWKVVPFPFIDYRTVYRLFIVWLWCHFTWFELYFARTMGRSKDGRISHQCVGDEMYPNCFGGDCPKDKRSMLENLLRQSGCGVFFEKRKIKEQYAEYFGRHHLENHLHERYSVVRCGMVTVSKQPRSRSSQPATNSTRRSRLRGLDNNRPSIPQSTTEIGSEDRLRQVCQSPQSQDTTIQSMEEVTERAARRRLQQLMDRGCSQLVLRAFQHYTQSDGPLYSVQGTNGVGSSSVDQQELVEAPPTIPSEMDTNVYQRFRTNSVREMRAAQEELVAIQGHPSGLSNTELDRTGLAIEIAGNRERTARSYDSYWNRFIQFCVDRKIPIPPNDDHVYRFLVYMYLITPSGKNCRSAQWAIKKRGEAEGWKLCGPRISRLVEKMITRSPVSRKLERDEWRICYISQFIVLGPNAGLDRRTFCTHVAVMIIGIRTMLRGSELGSILRKNVVPITKNGMSGIKLTIEHVKTDSSKKQGRVIEIEHTNSPRCPVTWINLCLKLNSGKYLFGKMLTTDHITTMLRTVAEKLGLSGTFSSHSLRIGGASEAAFVGFSRAAIQAMGDWSSNAIDTYFKAGFSSDRNVSDQMGL